MRPCFLCELFRNMNDRTRDLIVLNSAYGFVGCVSLLLAVSIIFGKDYGRLILVTVIPVYSLYYVVMYSRICNGYSNEVKRISAFGIIGRGTFVGVIYYLSLYLTPVLLLLLPVVS